MSTEHEAFGQLAEHISRAAEAARLIGRLRQDQEWSRIADLLTQIKDNAYALAMRKAH